MKIAGRKNPGAWYRINKMIKANPGGNVHTDLTAVISGIDTLAAFVAAMNDLAVKVGATIPPDLATTDLYALQLATKGIPENVWMGYLSFDTYTLSTVNGKKRYTPDHAAPVRQFGGDLRAAVTKYIFGVKKLIDVENAQTRAQGNPSGVADATKNT